MADQQSLRAMVVHYREKLIQLTICFVEESMRTLSMLILTMLFLPNLSFSQVVNMKDNVYYYQITHELKERLELEVKKQQKEYGGEVAFIVVIDFDGNVHVFEPSKSDEDKATYPRKAEVVKNVYGATIVGFEGSDCIDYIDTNGYKRRRCKSGSQ